MNIEQLIDRTLYLQEDGGPLLRVSGYSEDTVYVYDDESKGDEVSFDTMTFEYLEQNRDRIGFYELRLINTET